MDAETTLVFDTGPLSIFAQQNWLGARKAIVGQRTALVPDVVVDELRGGAVRDSRIQAALDSTWIETRELRTDVELSAFARFSSFLARGNRNVGECGVLALAHATGGVAVLDDGAARRTAERHQVVVRPTLALLCDGIRQGMLTVPLVSALADDLLAGKYRLPCAPGNFEKWATENGLLGGFIDS